MKKESVNYIVITTPISVAFALLISFAGVITVDGIQLISLVA